MTRTEKVESIEAMRQNFAATQHAVLVRSDGLTVEAVNGLRRKIREGQGAYTVVKNRLAVRAIQETALEPLAEHFTGPTAVAQTNEGPEVLAKVLTTFAKDHPQFEIKGGVVAGQTYDADQIRQLAEVPPIDELRSKLLNLMQSPMRRLAQVLSAPNRNLVTVLSQVAEKK